MSEKLNDFGFSTYSDDEYASQGQEKTTPVDENTLEDINYIRQRVDDIYQFMMTNHEEMSENFNISNERVSEKLRQVEDLILPLLQNLKNTADREWICWPNRDEILSDKINSILEITRSQ